MSYQDPGTRAKDCPPEQAKPASGKFLTQACRSAARGGPKTGKSAPPRRSLPFSPRRVAVRSRGHAAASLHLEVCKVAGYATLTRLYLRVAQGGKVGNPHPLYGDKGHGWPHACQLIQACTFYVCVRVYACMSYGPSLWQQGKELPFKPSCPRRLYATCRLEAPTLTVVVPTTIHGPALLNARRACWRAAAAAAAATCDQ